MCVSSVKGLTTVGQQVIVELLKTFPHVVWNRTLLFFWTMLEISQHDNLDRPNERNMNINMTL